ncbi:MAG: PIG-L family deacetylase [Fibrobacteres bacterium]|nr:PIG-L family deacetylase [Fibrobacterota bacterium]
MQEQYQFVRLVGEERRTGPTLKSVSRHFQNDKECFMFVSPHDDDAALGAGLFIQHTREEGIPVYILIVTDGSQGYCKAEQRGTIVETRKAETYRSYEKLGIPSEYVMQLAFPDNGLTTYLGRRTVRDYDATNLCYQGFTGLQNAFTLALREIRPTQCFIPTPNDLHPDHKITYNEFMISVFHATGGIWPELGKPLDKLPYLHEYAVYCDFSSAPNVRIKAPESAFEKKLQSILEYKSQEQIQSLVDAVRATGPWEFLKNVEFNLYSPMRHKQRFEEQMHINVLHIPK